jgi:hypothetical protein
MRIIRSILLALLFLVGVVVASANVHLVELVIFPDLGIEALPNKISIELPLFVIVITALGGGVLLGGLAAALEQIRLRHGLRRARKERDRALEEQGKADALLDAARGEADGLRAQISELSAELAEARGGLDEPLSPFVEPQAASDAAAQGGQEAPDRPDVGGRRAGGDDTIRREAAGDAKSSESDPPSSPIARDED